MEKRKTGRVAKRLEVKFQSPVEKTAITNDLSETGIFIKTNMGVNDGNIISFKMNLPNTQEIPLTGRVARSVRTMLGLIGESKSGIGVHLVDPPENYVNYVQSLFINHVNSK
ncbi:MAG: PilZ domain-containing protein [Nitrospirae bacterium]|nr:PilZ domain-containing protein [Nitrospirota bacterium]